MAWYSTQRSRSASQTIFPIPVYKMEHCTCFRIWRPSRHCGVASLVMAKNAFVDTNCNCSALYRSTRRRRHRHTTRPPHIIARRDKDPAGVLSNVWLLQNATSRSYRALTSTFLLGLEILCMGRTWIWISLVWHTTAGPWPCIRRMEQPRRKLLLGIILRHISKEPNRPCGRVT